jgi:hypothetical protein
MTLECPHHELHHLDPLLLIPIKLDLVGCFLRLNRSSTSFNLLDLAASQGVAIESKLLLGNYHFLILSLLSIFGDGLTSFSQTHQRLGFGLSLGKGVTGEHNLFINDYIYYRLFNQF